MFTGIVQAVGRIASATAHADGQRLLVDAAEWPLADVAIGDSICVNGCCLTVVETNGRALAFDVSAETMRRTAGLQPAARVNLEKSLRLADRLGGHLVLGHVDGVGRVQRLEPVAREEQGGSWLFVVEAPASLARFVAVKGSIAVHGVSLTVNEVDGPRFAVNLIPHTLAVTNLRDLAPGAHVNLEVDVVARYVARLSEFETTATTDERAAIGR
jgi:riboflavin synthase